MGKGSRSIKTYIKFRKRNSANNQMFMQNFVDACLKSGFKSIPDRFHSYKFHIRSAFNRLFILIRSIQNLFHLNIKPSKALIITANGGTINENVFPYYWGYEIIPVLWDNWPSNYTNFIHSVKLFDIKTVFVTSRQVSERINRETDVEAYWIPEGINKSLYKKGGDLSQRCIDVLELGRQMHQYHKVLSKLYDIGQITLTSSSVTISGLKDEKKLLYASDADLAEGIIKHKIFICFPQCDTTPNRAGDIETLTQRYWEGMLSRCILIGRAPKELIDLIGYNPVIDVDWKNPESQLLDILNNLKKYQNFVDKNYDVALKYSPWENSVELIKRVLIDKRYSL